MTYIIKMVWQKYNMVSRGSPGPSRELTALSKIHDNSFSYKYHLYGKKVPQLVNLRCHIIFDYDLLSMLCSYNVNAYSILWLYIKVRELQCPFNFLKFFRHITLFEFWFDFYLISLECLSFSISNLTWCIKASLRVIYLSHVILTNNLAYSSPSQQNNYT